jgi:aminopeptidase N
VNAGKTAIGNGVLVSQQANPADAQFPKGSTTWHWRSGAPVASYLVEASVGSFDLSQRTVGGIRYYQAQPSSLTASRMQINRSIMNKQGDVTAFESGFNGPFPFSSDGVIIGLPKASFAEEMQTMIAFPGGQIDLDTLYHENMHQWWGDNVSEANYNLTFFKEGMATLGEFLFAARTAQAKSGPAAFDASLRKQFATSYANRKVFTWAPSNPTPYGLFSSASTYLRPALAYVALRQILGATNFAATLQQVQERYGGAAITEQQWEAAFAQALPHPTATCRTKLATFFTQWFDTDYPTAGGATRPTLTGPGLAGPGFSC